MLLAGLNNLLEKLKEEIMKMDLVEAQKRGKERLAQLRGALGSLVSNRKSFVEEAEELSKRRSAVAKELQRGIELQLAANEAIKEANLFNLEKVVADAEAVSLDETKLIRKQRELVQQEEVRVPMGEILQEIISTSAVFKAFREETEEG